jgi:hypothetical protein
MKTATWIGIGIGAVAATAFVVWRKREADRKAEVEAQLAAVVETLDGQGVEVTDEDVQDLAVEIDRLSRLSADRSRTTVHEAASTAVSPGGRIGVGR